MRGLILLSLLANFVSVANAECANACSGHGKCTSYDMCICNRNWQANDCSERVCQFGLAHVDTPKGDLDGSGTISSADHNVVENSFNYPYGTSEQYPAVQDSDLNILSDTAHYYMECSNKGTCDRSTGLCNCYDGYDGVACQRASCPGYPNSCSGHGVCASIKQLAALDHGNVYKLWDKDTTMGCSCDAGYFGPDCSQRECKFGVDPLYLDDVSTVKYSTFDVAILATTTALENTAFTDGQNVQKQGFWALRFYDAHGEDWLSNPIVAGASCAQVLTAIEAIPNNVIPAAQTYCTKSSTLTAGEYEGDIRGIDAQHTGRDNYHMSPDNRQYYIAYNISMWDADVNSLDPFSAIAGHTASYETNTIKLFGYIYRLKFYGNPGALKQPSVEVYLDGKRPSLIAKSGSTLSRDQTVITKVWTDGQQGEFNDYFADHCNGVTVTIGRYAVGVSYLNGLTANEKKLLQTCLGSSDFDTSNNVGQENWDYGSIFYPHIIKLVRTVTTYTDGGYYAVVYYDATSGLFKLLNPFTPPDGYLTDSYEVYTTQGTLALTSNFSEVVFSFGSNVMYMANITADTYTDIRQAYDGDLSCEVGNNNAFKMKYIFHCLNKGDMFTVLNWEFPQYNPPHINLYTAQRLIHTDFLFNVSQRYSDSVISNPVRYGAMQYQTHSITTDLSTNWAASARGKSNTIVEGPAMYRVYKFFPSTTSTYNYVAQCSNRGICDNAAGTCNCFPGYTSDSCSEQASIAL